MKGRKIMANRSPFKIGWRTIKTVVGVFIILLLFHWLDRAPATLACLACVFAMQEDIPTSITFGRYRIIGNTLGALIAALVVQVKLIFGIDNPYIHIVAVSLGILLVIVSCNVLNSNKSIVNSSATYFVVLLTISTSELASYTVDRILDCFIGVVIAVAVNYLLPGSKPKPLLNEAEESVS